MKHTAVCVSLGAPTSFLLLTPVTHLSVAVPTPAAGIAVAYRMSSELTYDPEHLQRDDPSTHKASPLSEVTEPVQFCSC